MTTPDLVRTLDAVANRMPVIAGLTTERRRSVTADAQTVIDREGAVDHVVQRLRDIQPKHSEKHAGDTIGTLRGFAAIFLGRALPAVAVPSTAGVDEG